MNTINKLFALIAACFFLSLGTTSCKKAVKEAGQALSKESLSEGAETLIKKSGKKTLREFEEKAIKELQFDDFIKLLKKDFPTIHLSFSQFDDLFQKQIVEAIRKHPELLQDILSSKTIIDQFSILTKSVPDFAKNIDFFRFFVKQQKVGGLNDIFIRQADGYVEFCNKSGNEILAKYRDGVMELLNAFDAKQRILNNEVLNKELMPNTLYKVRGKMGLSYLIQADELGRVLSAEAKGLNPDEVVLNILRRNNDINLGQEWNATFKKIKEASRGEDVNVKILFHHADNNVSPTTVSIDIEAANTKISKKYVNLSKSINQHYTSAQNEKLLRTLSQSVNIPQDKFVTLLQLMDADDGFAEFIHKNPKFNIKRWLHTRNHVDQNLLAKASNGRTVINGKVYAGNVFYFNPYLNPKLAHRLQDKNGLASLKKAGILSREQLEELDHLFPNGVPFSKEGFPDFTGVAFKGKDGAPMIIDVAERGTREADIRKAESIFESMGYKPQEGHTWHHIENSTKLVLVPSNIHQLIDHTGDVALRGSIGQ